MIQLKQKQTISQDNYYQFQLSYYLTPKKTERVTPLIVRPGGFEPPTYGLEVLCVLAYTLKVFSETAYLSMLI